MFPAIETRDMDAVAAEVRGIFLQMFPGSDDGFVARAFGWLRDSFEGRHPGYCALDLKYHDLEHTLQGTLCLMRLLRTREAAGAVPAVTEKMFELGLLAILLHDTGYLKRADDAEGTGAKYTLVHVRRSAEFAHAVMAANGYPGDDITAVENMIRCTGINADLAAISFVNEIEKIMGYALGTADLLAQMAADDYVEKLSLLYEEFCEAVRFNAGQGGNSIAFKNADDLVRHTPGFWRDYVWPKINEDFGQLYKFLNDPYPDGPNEYVDRVRGNIAQIERRYAAGH